MVLVVVVRRCIASVVAGAGGLVGAASKTSFGFRVLLHRQCMSVLLVFRGYRASGVYLFLVFRCFRALAYRV